MTPHDLTDITDHIVATVPLLEPDAARAARVRERCIARLRRNHRRSRRLSSISRFGRHIAAPAIIAGLFALYAADLLSITLRTFTA